MLAGFNLELGNKLEGSYGFTWTPNHELNTDGRPNFQKTKHSKDKQKLFQPAKWGCRQRAKITYKQIDPQKNDTKNYLTFY